MKQFSDQNQFVKKKNREIIANGTIYKFYVGTLDTQAKENRYMKKLFTNLKISNSLKVLPAVVHYMPFYYSAKGKEMIKVLSEKMAED